MGDGALLGVTDGLRVFPQRARLVVVPARGPRSLAAGQFGVRQRHVDRALDRVNDDRVAVLEQTDGAADRGLGPDMADAEPVARAREPAVRDQRHLLAPALADQRAGRRQHLAHAGAALWPLVADDDDVALLVGAFADRLERVLLAVETARRPGELQPFHAGNLYDRPLRREVALEHHHAAGRRERARGRSDDVLPGWEDHVLEVLGDGFAGHGDAVAMQVAAVEQRLHQDRHAADLVQVFHHVFAARLEVADIGRAGEDAADLGQVKIDPGFGGDRGRCSPELVEPPAAATTVAAFSSDLRVT